MTGGIYRVEHDFLFVDGVVTWLVGRLRPIGFPQTLRFHAGGEHVMRKI